MKLFFAPLTLLEMPAFLVPIYGADSPFRLWAIALTICLLACLPRPTRRIGAIGFIVILACMGISFVLRGVFASFTPH